MPPLPLSAIVDSSFRHLRRMTTALLVASAAAGCASDRQRPPDLVSLIADAAPAVVGISDGKEVLGSGFRIGATSLIATAAHVAKALKDNEPRLVWQSQTWRGRLRQMDEAADLAVIELSDAAPIPGLPLAGDGDPPRPGEWIVVLGCPFGRSTTATTGIVSALPGAVQQPAALRRRMQLNAAVNPGNSGGPIVNMAGEVVGIANATVPGGYGLGFAVPVVDLKPLLTQERAAP